MTRNQVEKLPAGAVVGNKINGKYSRTYSKGLVLEPTQDGKILVCWSLAGRQRIQTFRTWDRQGGWERTDDKLWRLMKRIA